MEIKKIGGVQKLDKDGYIINDFSIENIQPEYKIILDEIVGLVLKVLGDNLHSIYLRGSVLKGQAVKYVSDMDTYIVTRSSIDMNQLGSKFDEIEKSLIAKYPYLLGVELITKTLEEVNENSRIQFVLKTQSKCVFGEDITTYYPNFRIGRLSYAHAYGLENSISKAFKWLEEDNHNSNEIKLTCTWIMKRLVRVGYELVMKWEGAFTRDLYYCYEGFSEYYPEYAGKMKAVLYV